MHDAAIQLAREITEPLRRVLLLIVHHPQALRLKVEPLHSQVAVTWRTHPRDAARLIGKHGANFNALRALLEAAGTRAGVPVKVCRLDEPNPHDHSPEQPLRRDPDVVMEALGGFAVAVLGGGDWVKGIAGTSAWRVTVRAPGGTNFAPLNPHFQTVADSVARTQGGAAILVDLTEGA